MGGISQNIMPKERKFHNSDLSARATDLRSNLTKHEKKLWYRFLRKLPVHFCRQKVIGNYIVDFYCAEYSLVVELDGSQHYEEEGESYDRMRDAYLSSLGLKVLRYSNLDIDRNFKNICADILCHIGME